MYINIVSRQVNDKYVIYNISIVYCIPIYISISLIGLLYCIHIRAKGKYPIGGRLINDNLYISLKALLYEYTCIRI